MEQKDKQYYSKIIKKRKFKPEIKIIAGFFGILLFSFLSIALFNEIFTFSTPLTLYYNENASTNYRVYLKENDYFEEKYLGSGKQYITNLIDYIELDFNYALNASNPFDYEYKYYATATVTANEKNEPSKILYTKESKILENVIEKNSDSGVYNLNKKIKINYDEYNAVINNFKKDYILSVDSKMVVKFFVELSGKYGLSNTPIKTEHIMSVSIPLSQQTIDIKVLSNNLNESNSAIEKNISKNINLLFLILTLISVLITLILTIKTLRLIIKLNNQKTEYIKKLNKIMREYDRIVVKTKNMPLLDNYDIIEVDTFNELLDAREGLDKTILFIELIPRHESLFIIISESLAYLYVLNDEKEKDEQWKK